MFKCQVSGVQTPAGPTKDNSSNAYKIVTQTRQTTYFYVKNRDGKTFQVSRNELDDLERRGIADADNTTITNGYEIVEEKLVCKSVYEKWVANGGKVC